MIGGHYLRKPRRCSDGEIRKTVSGTLRLWSVHRSSVGAVPSAPMKTFRGMPAVPSAATTDSKSRWLTIRSRIFFLSRIRATTFVNVPKPHDIRARCTWGRGELNFHCTQRANVFTVHTHRGTLLAKQIKEGLCTGKRMTRYCSESVRSVALNQPGECGSLTRPVSVLQTCRWPVAREGLRLRPNIPCFRSPRPAPCARKLDDALIFATTTALGAVAFLWLPQQHDAKNKKRSAFPARRNESISLRAHPEPYPITLLLQLDRVGGGA